MLWSHPTWMCEGCGGHSFCHGSGWFAFARLTALNNAAGAPVVGSIKTCGRSLEQCDVIAIAHAVVNMYLVVKRAPPRVRHGERERLKNEVSERKHLW